MRWIRFTSSGSAPRLGVLIGDDVHVSAESRSIVELLREHALDDAGTQATANPVDVIPIAAVDLLAPITHPPSIRDFMAFEQHVDGVSRLVNGTADVPDVWYSQPLFYFSNPTAVIGPHDDVAMPPGCSVFDFELEVAAVVGTGGGDLTLDEAEEAVAGYLIMNDWSARDLQFTEMRGPLGPCKGKDSAITLGPWFVTSDELAASRSRLSFDLGLSVWVNDELLGTDRLDNMGWSFPEMVAYASRGTRVEAGDVFGSGTCGDGCLAELWGRRGRDAHSSLRPGDVVRMAVDGLGEIRNRVVASKPIRQPLAPRIRHS